MLLPSKSPAHPPDFFILPVKSPFFRVEPLKIRKKILPKSYTLYYGEAAPCF